MTVFLRSCTLSSHIPETFHLRAGFRLSGISPRHRWTFYPSLSVFLCYFGIQKDGVKLHWIVWEGERCGDMPVGM